MSALHSKKIETEKNAFVNSLFSNIPQKDLYLNGDLSIKARTIHKAILPIYIMKYYSKTCYPSKYLEVILTNIIESESFLLLGFPNACFISLRSAVESAFKFLYYEYHPIERELHLDNLNHTLTGKDYREFFYIFPQLSKLEFLSRDVLENLWKTLCKYVHCDLQVIKQMTLVSNISIELLEDEAKFAKTLDIYKLVSKFIIAIFFAINPAWAKDVEKVYYDAILEAYSLEEKELIKNVLKIY